MDLELPSDAPVVAEIPLPPFADTAEHRRYVRMLQLHLALLDDGDPALSTIAVSAALEDALARDTESDPWLTPLECSVSLTSWFPAPWTPEALARPLSREHRDPPVFADGAWRWLFDPDFTARAGIDGGWEIIRHERGSRSVATVQTDRALTTLWMSHFRTKFAFPLGHAVQPADLETLTQASIAVKTADATDAARPYRSSWRRMRDETITATGDQDTNG
ncbi:hypothetical protein HII28_19805 [Planctomonas sp. JC2975]|uniref:hypothetical protein n=1 Tax=Planctomonas sp. JC2975 TaxID=2729626 RepID=UPI001472EC71|nr:hypothetical protein [Planctomonas sp. JC2975]NNC14102.1 hypothetical protein [Planctomonas sp. JC2975]